MYSLVVDLLTRLSHPSHHVRCNRSWAAILFIASNGLLLAFFAFVFACSPSPPTTTFGNAGSILDERCYVILVGRRDQETRLTLQLEDALLSACQKPADRYRSDSDCRSGAHNRQTRTTCSERAHCVGNIQFKCWSNEGHIGIIPVVGTYSESAMGIMRE